MDLFQKLSVQAVQSLLEPGSPSEPIARTQNLAKVLRSSRYNVAYAIQEALSGFQDSREHGACMHVSARCHGAFRGLRFDPALISFAS